MLTLIAIGIVAGVISGLAGVGGGVVFVPGLVLLVGLKQHQAEATSLLAIIPAVLVGAISQRRYGNVRLKDGLTIGLFSVGGVIGGVVLANALSAGALRIAFAILMVVVAARLIQRSLRNGSGGDGSTDAAMDRGAESRRMTADGQGKRAQG